MKLGSAIPWALLLSTATLVSGAWNRRPHKCGGVLRDLSGRISTYEGPKTDCIWTILAKPGSRVFVAIPYLNLACGKEYVEVQDGLPGAGNYGKLCSGIGLTYQSSSNALSIKYSRTAGHMASSFDIYYYGDS
uniref:Porcine seminal protein II n=1 Tax=Sus scrofa TaxID=9823 RepID=A0A8D0ME19_PIG